MLLVIVQDYNQWLCSTRSVKAIDNYTLKALLKEALKHAFIHSSNHNLQCVCEYVSFRV